MKLEAAENALFMLGVFLVVLALVWAFFLLRLVFVTMRKWPRLSHCYGMPAIGVLVIAAVITVYAIGAYKALKETVPHPGTAPAENSEEWRPEPTLTIGEVFGR